MKLDGSAAFWQSQLDTVSAQMCTFPTSFWELPLPPMLRKSMARGHTSMCVLRSELLAGHQNQREKYSNEPGLQA